MSSETEYVPFDFYLPLPYRVVLLINIGILLWHLNLVTCFHFKIDIMQVLKLAPQEITLSKMIYRSKRRLINITFANILNYSIYFFFTSNGFDLSLTDYLPLLAIITSFWILLRIDRSSDSQRLSQTMTRVIRGDIDINMRNNDILLTDTFTSYNKVLVDLFVYISALILGMQALPKGSDISAQLSKNHLQSYCIDLLLANFPSLLRFQQCLKEYNESNRGNIQHLLNAIKYSTAFLPTISMILFKCGVLKTQSLWYFTTFINSSYSFYWDITNDWNFGFFTKFLTSRSNIKLFRSRMVYSKTVYTIAILIDLQLRYLWLYKLFYVTSATHEATAITSFFIMLFTTEMGNFILEILEIFRRWVWVFIKVETEYVKMASSDQALELQTFD